MKKKDYKIPDILTFHNFRYSSLLVCYTRTRYQVMHKEIFKDYYITSKEIARPRIVASLTWLILSLLLCIPFGLIMANTTPNLEQRSGVVKDGNVKYVQNTVKYVSLSELGLSPDDVGDGEKVTLYFDNDKITSVKTETDSQNEMKIIFPGIAFLCFITPMAVGIIRFAGAGKYTLGQVASSTYKYENIGSKIKMERLCAYMYKNGDLAFEDLRPSYLDYVVKYKSYKNRITVVTCVIHNSEKSKKKKIWLLNDEPLYDTILGCKIK